MRIDTHRHLGGCIPPWWVWHTIKNRGWTFLATSESDVTNEMTFEESEDKTFHRFLDKFKILDKIEWDEELIDSSIGAICQEMEKDKLDFCWLDFSINKYMESMTWHKKEAIQFIRNSFQKYRPNKVGLILSLKYESMRASQRQYAKLIEDQEVADCLMGIDLVGDETYFDSSFYVPIFRDWNAAGKMTRAHVAESQSAENGRYAIVDLKVTNIAHGLRMARYDDMLELAKDNDVSFDLGVSSNFYTGVWSNRFYHPINTMLSKNLKVTLGTDDPVQCQNNLDAEYDLVKQFGVTEDQLQTIANTALNNTKKFTNFHENIC